MELIDIDAAILAGGKGSRMNYIDKSQLLYKEKTFLEIILSRLSPFSRKMVISNKPQEEYPYIDADFYGDLIKDIGPMGGIYTALKQSNSTHVFITTCDMPFIEDVHIQRICADTKWDIVIPSYKGKYEMLFALYSTKCITQFEKLIQEKRFKITGVFEDTSLKVKELDIDDEFLNSLKNINTYSEYSTLE